MTDETKTPVVRVARLNRIEDGAIQVKFKDDSVETYGIPTDAKGLQQVAAQGLWHFINNAYGTEKDPSVAKNLIQEVLTRLYAGTFQPKTRKGAVPKALLSIETLIEAIRLRQPKYTADRARAALEKMGADQWPVVQKNYSAELKVLRERAATKASPAADDAEFEASLVAVAPPKVKKAA